MRVLLVHNPGAGEDGHEASGLADFIERAGHTARTIGSDSDIERHAQGPFDLVAAAGGDGTVTKVARALAGPETPFTILPLGTANNIARSLGIQGEPEVLVRGWEHGTVHPFDNATVTHPRGKDGFIESAGFGLFTEALCLALSHQDTGNKFTAEERFDRDFRLLRRLAGTLPSFRSTLEVDGSSSEESLVLCEVMNTRQIGSRLVLAPDADTGDGFLDLVIVRERERPLLQEFLRRDPSDDHRPHLQIRRGRRFRITSQARRLHLADRVERFMTGTNPWDLEVSVNPGALRVLLPAM